MKKRFLILAAVAVSGVAAVVAGNTNKFVRSEADANVIEVTEGSTWYFCVSLGGTCTINGHGWALDLPGYYKYYKN